MPELIINLKNTKECELMIKVIQPEEVGFSSERLNRITKRMLNYVAQGDTGGIITLVERKGEVAHLAMCGFQDIAGAKPMELNTIFRIYSMTKPIVSVALMMLYEQARFQLSDPLHKYLPEFKDLKVLEPGGGLVPPRSEITIHHLLTHTAGLTYGIFGETAVDKLYQAANLNEKGIALQEMVRRLASLPLLYHPGEGWVYSFATDVVGRLVEVLSGMSLAEYLDAKVFGPLGMVDTAFSAPPEKIDRLAICYAETEYEKMVVFDNAENSTYREVTCYSGGGGLVSTLEDYLQFARLLRNGGELNGVRLLGRKTLDMMTMNHLPASLLPFSLRQPIPGLGFGLGVSVLMDVAQFQVLGSVGSYGWSGLASTTFWVDPLEDIVAIFLTQYIPLENQPFHVDFRNLVYQALVD
jgi:CubicO group peptidase (beta-lactamase class C family)